ncbi:MAG TPA: response regulator transcription factor [Microbacteriaceae bacterium]|nr:response regulator transcription factor [Microbacteriaceae bacterium]
MAQLLVLTSELATEALPALSLLPHRTRSIPASPEQLVRAPEADVVFLDARANLVAAKSLSQILQTTGISAPLILIVTEGGLAAVSPDWGVDDVVLDHAGPAEIDARIRLALGKRNAESVQSEIHHSGISIDEVSYTARVNGAVLNLTFKEFELLRFLAAHPARVFTREQLLSEVWGYDYFGGTRTVDVHVRRLRAKLGDLEHLIGTVRNVGYRFASLESDASSPATRLAN